MYLKLFWVGISTVLQWQSIDASSDPSDTICRFYGEKGGWTWQPTEDPGQRAYFCKGDVNQPNTYRGELLGKNLILDGDVQVVHDVTAEVDPEFAGYMPLRLVAEPQPETILSNSFNPSTACFPGELQFAPHV